MEFRFYVTCLLSFIFCHIAQCMRIPWRNGGSNVILQNSPFPRQMFHCIDGKIIDLNQVCDGYRHCTDDELWCAACSFETTDGAFSCIVGGESKCIEPNQICDGRRNCDLGTDEQNCDSMQMFASTLARRKRMQKESRNKAVTLIKPTMKKRYEKPCRNNRNYCWNGGNCFYIDNPKKRFCLCKTGYEGPRCMHLSPSEYSSY